MLTEAPPRPVKIVAWVVAGCLSALACFETHAASSVLDPDPGVRQPVSVGTPDTTPTVSPPAGGDLAESGWLDQAVAAYVESLQ
jgi:hypothetical protein